MVESINKEPLVSIITPCYNGEKYVYRLLDSILSQTYKNIEFIFVNDGSTDKTEKIVMSYKDKFEKYGIKLIYLYQENKGLAGAINAGLKIFSGDYLCWPDSDDFLSSTSIEKRVMFLENNLQYGCVSSDANVYDENNLDKPLYRIADKQNNEFANSQFANNQFMYLLEEKSIFCTGCHMIRAKAFLDVNPGRKIYQARRGQNWQLLLPVYYKYKRAFIDEPLYNYIIYNSSMSRGDDSLEKKLIRFNEHESILINTIITINMPDEEKMKYLDFIKKRYIKKREAAAFEFKNIDIFETYYIELKKYNLLEIRDYLMRLRIKFKAFDNIYRVLTLSIKRIKKRELL